MFIEILKNLVLELKIIMSLSAYNIVKNLDL